MESKYNLSKRLKMLREERQMTLAGFSKMLEIPKSTLHNAESGKSVTLDTVDFIAGKLNIPAVALLQDDLDIQVGVFAQLAHGFEWYSRMSAEDQAEMAQLMERVGKILQKYPREDMK